VCHHGKTRAKDEVLFAQASQSGTAAEVWAYNGKTRAKDEVLFAFVDPTLANMSPAARYAVHPLGTG
jgi:hypothetical protein